jgi:transcriptional regulator with XRE-family HTH domain
VLLDETFRALGYSEIARRTGTTPGFISLLFRGRRHAKAETLSRIAQALGVSMDELHTHLSKISKDGRRYGWGQVPKQEKYEKAQERVKARAGEAA